MKLKKLKKNSRWMSLYLFFSNHYSMESMLALRTSPLTVCEISGVLISGVFRYTTGILAGLVFLLFFLASAYFGFILVPSVFLGFLGSSFFAELSPKLILGMSDSHEVFLTWGLGVDVSLILGLMLYLHSKYEIRKFHKQMGQRVPLEEPGFIAKAWQDFKEKTCTIVELVD